MSQTTETTKAAAPTIVSTPLDLTHVSPEMFAALAAAQGEIENATKNATNKHLANNYADLGEVLSEIRKVFPKNGLVLIQSPSFDGLYVDIITVIGHTSGAYITSRLGAAVPMASIQGVGAGITYLRRYAAAALAGIAQEDADGEAMAAAMQQDQSGNQGREQRREPQQSSQQRMPQAKKPAPQQDDTTTQQQAPEKEQQDHPPGVLFGTGISKGQEGLIRAKGLAAGLPDDQAIYEWFGTVTPENINDFMTKVRDRTAQQ